MVIKSNEVLSVIAALSDEEKLQVFLPGARVWLSSVMTERFDRSPSENVPREA